MEAARGPARLLLDNNPDLQLHHMRDPVQDHLMLRVMTYFRVKRLRLGPTYERFLSDVLEPGGTIFLVECEQRWPTRSEAHTSELQSLMRISYRVFCLKKKKNK